MVPSEEWKEKIEPAIYLADEAQNHIMSPHFKLEINLPVATRLRYHISGLVDSAQNSAAAETPLSISPRREENRHKNVRTSSHLREHQEYDAKGGMGDHTRSKSMSNFN